MRLLRLSSLLVSSSLPFFSYAFINDTYRLELQAQTQALFRHGYDSYMTHAWPADELKPLSCRGDGHASSDLQISDVSGNYSMTLIDVLDTHVVMGDRRGFEDAVKMVIDTVSFDQDAKVQVFEVVIRVLGGLLSAHLFASTPSVRPEFAVKGYNGKLLDMSLDLANRLLPAFDTPTGIPWARINLRHGLDPQESVETCSAGAGSLILELATLSRLSGDPRFETAARKAFFAIWNRRSVLDLVGNSISVQGHWMSVVSHIGAGTDSFFEYAFKAYVLLGDDAFYDVWKEGYDAIMTHVRGEEGFWFRGVHQVTGARVGLTVDSLAAFWPGLQSLSGDVENATKSHLAYYNLWRRFDGMPEGFHTVEKLPESLAYPLRPEFVESTWYLYRSTRDPFYLDVGKEILDSLKKAVVPCGFASFANLDTGELVDRQESFALSETLKYLYLLFDEDNWVNRDGSNMVFTTEGHLLVLNSSHLEPSSTIRRNLRSHETLTCPDPLSTRFSHGDGLRTGVRSRQDYEFARHLVNLSLDAVEATDGPFWDTEGTCSSPKEEAYTIEVSFSTPADDAVDVPVEPIEPVNAKSWSGFIVNDVRRLRAHVTKRLDGWGFDITKLGSYKVRTGQSVYVTAEKIVDMYDQGDKEFQEAAISHRAEFLIEGSPTIYASIGLATTKYKRSPFPRSLSDPTPLILNPNHLSDPTGCSPYPPPPPLHYNLSPPSPNNPVPSPFVLLIRRGSCTFFEKLVHARAAGATAVVVWSSSSEMIQPFLANPEPEMDPNGSEVDDPLEGGTTLMHLPDGGGVGWGEMLERLLREGKEVKTMLPDGEEGGASHAGRRTSSERRLWIANEPVLNAAIVRREAVPDA